MTSVLRGLKAGHRSCLVSEVSDTFVRGGGGGCPAVFPWENISLHSFDMVNPVVSSYKNSLTERNGLALDIFIIM